MRKLKPKMAKAPKTSPEPAAANSTTSLLETTPNNQDISPGNSGFIPPPLSEDFAKEDKIKDLVREYITHLEDFKESQTQGDQALMKKTIAQAKETQVPLQKLMNRKEVEEYVKVWNHWYQLSQLKWKNYMVNKRSSSHLKPKAPRYWENVISLALE